MNAQAYIVITTTENQEEAATLGRLMVERRLAACAQVSGPIDSIYWWQGRIESDTEWRCLFKTTGESYKALETAIREAHPYDVPQIVAIPINKGSREYLLWIEETLSQHP